MSSMLILGCAALLVAVAVLTTLLQRARRDVAGLRRQLQAAENARQTKDSQLSQQSALDTIKDEFISNVSHELRTPLTSIRGALGLLSAGLMGSMDAKAQNLLRIAVSNTDRLIRLINDILDLERMQSGRAPMQVRRCSLLELATQSIETMAAMADGAGVRLECTVSAPPEAVFFDGDSDRILQVLTNLLSNAIKFSPAASTVQVRIESAADAVLLRVSDEGRGIPVDKLEAIFDRFGQVEQADSKQKGGTGLGLAICRTIIEQHNGAIWAESNPQHRRGPGASLLLTLPRTARLDDEAGAPLALPATPPHPSTLVLCDDDPGIRAVVGEHLTRHGYRILEAENGEQALALAGEQGVEAILLDLYMPGLTGWETLRQLKHSPATAGIPVVILSVLPPSGRGESALVEASAQGWVQKPFNENLLLAELSRVLHTGDGLASILLVEDDADLAAVVIAGFADANVHVEHASTRQNAIERCLTTRPDLIILDLTLPDGDGFSLVDWLRQQPDLRALPLVVYSGRDVSDAEMSKLRLGPTQFLTKARVEPHEVEELVLNIVQRMRRPPAASALPPATESGARLASTP